MNMRDFSGSKPLSYAIIAAGPVIVAAVLLVRYGMFAPAEPTAEELHAAALGNGEQAERIEAAVQLARHAEATNAMLRDVIQNSELPAAQAAAMAGLGKRRDVDSLPLLIDAMEDESELIRGRAGAAVERIVGLDYGFDPSAAEEQRSQAVARYRKFWDECQQPDSKFLEYMRNPEAVETAAPPPRKSGKD